MQIVDWLILLYIQIIIIWFIVYSYFICDLGTVKLLSRGGGDSVLNVSNISK